MGLSNVIFFQISLGQVGSPSKSLYTATISVAGPSGARAVVVGSFWLTVVTFYSLDPRMGMVGSAIVGTVAADCGGL